MNAGERLGSTKSLKIHCKMYEFRVVSQRFFPIFPFSCSTPHRLLFLPPLSKPVPSPFFPQSICHNTSISPINGYVIIMGCGSSSSSGGHKKNKIDFDMERTRVHEFDSVFEGVAEPLSTLLDTRNTLMKGKRELEQAAGTRKRLKDATFTDNVMGMMYCYSASTNGDLSELEFRCTKHAPYFNVKKSSLRPEFQKIPNAFEYFLEKLLKVPEKLSPLAGQIKDAAERAAGKSLYSLSRAN